MIIKEVTRTHPTLSVLEGLVFVVVSWASALFVSCLLVSSAITHLANPYAYLDAVERYRLLPIVFAEVLASFLPFVHIAVSVLLVAGQSRCAAFRAGSILFGIYTVAQVTVLARGMEIACGCFSGAASNMELIGTRSVALAVLALTACLLGELCVRLVESRRATPTASR